MDQSRFGEQLSQKVNKHGDFGPLGYYAIAAAKQRGIQIHRRREERPMVQLVVNGTKVGTQADPRLGRRKSSSSFSSIWPGAACLLSGAQLGKPDANGGQALRQLPTQGPLECPRAGDPRAGIGPEPTTGAGGRVTARAPLGLE